MKGLVYSANIVLIYEECTGISTNFHLSIKLFAKKHNTVTNHSSSNRDILYCMIVKSVKL